MNDAEVEGAAVNGGVPSSHLGRRVFPPYLVPNEKSVRIRAWIRLCFRAESGLKHGLGFDGGVSDILIMTLGLLAGVVGCLARPCKPEQWSHVKAARVALEAAPLSSHQPDFERVSEPGFADGLTAAAA